LEISLATTPILETKEMACTPPLSQAIMSAPLEPLVFPRFSTGSTQVYEDDTRVAAGSKKVTMLPCHDTAIITFNHKSFSIFDLIGMIVAPL
jgi:hypothetical protein